jgi:hypothetical protein
VPDIPTSSGRAGEVRVCVTAGTLESPALPALDAPAIGFRQAEVLSTQLMTGVAYHFRVFPADVFADGSECTTTSQKPLAELSASRRAFVPGHAYTLTFMGALLPGPICAPVGDAALARPGCARPLDELGAQLTLVPNQ